MAEVQSKAIELNQKLIEAQHEIFTANAEHSKLIQHVSELELKITDMQAWKEQKKSYKLTNPWNNPALVYAVRESCKETETAHWICTKCYDDGKRSILQPNKDKKGLIMLVCSTCGAEIHTGYSGIGPPGFVKD